VTKVTLPHKQAKYFLKYFEPACMNLRCAGSMAKKSGKGRGRDQK
jgi:hypothetical protein